MPSILYIVLFFLFLYCFIKYICVFFFICAIYLSDLSLFLTVRCPGYKAMDILFKSPHLKGEIAFIFGEKKKTDSAKNDIWIGSEEFYLLRLQNNF